VPPQTSTIASHLPKATGTAFALSRARRLGVDPGVAPDAIVCCTFGDASANHATALSGIHAARYAHRRGAPVPILFVCEDNDRDSRRDAQGLRADLPGAPAHEAGDACLDPIRRRGGGRCRPGAPATTRLFGHAGSDLETSHYHVSREAIEARSAARERAALVESGAGAGDLRRSS
jgi:2-oxoisovalerate dehydrogenase E1 component